MAITAQQAPIGSLDWLRPAVDEAELATGYWPPLAARGARVATRTPGLGPGSVKVAREFAGQTVQRWGMPDLANDVGIVISELLTNALRHGLRCCSQYADPFPIRIGLLYPGGCVLCAVADPSHQVPVVKCADYLAESGRGLHVVASLCDYWGWTAPDHAGKVVWATFRLPSAL